MVTLFSVPKPFRGQIEIIQRNAIQSWTCLRPHAEIILFGDDDGTSRVAKEFDVRHIPGIARNEYGTPLLNDVFEQAQRSATQDVLCYVNADIILMSDLLDAVRRVTRWRRRFLLVGQRWDVDIRERLSFSPGWESSLRHRVAAQARLHSGIGIDYFIFPRKLWSDIPPFAIGRTTWDNWLIYRARVMGVPVLDATETLMAVHQNHDYSHIPAKAIDVWKGPEATLNLCLAGGVDHIFSLQDATHKLTQSGPKVALSRSLLQRHLETLPMLYPHLAPLVRLARGLIRVSRRVRLVSRKDHTHLDKGRYPR